VRPRLEFPRSNASPEEIKEWLKTVDEAARYRPPPPERIAPTLAAVAWILGCGLAFCVGMIVGAVLRMVTP
jgi:hypothetical protein